MTTPSLLEINSMDLLGAALAYAERGWPVLPLKPRDKPPAGRLVRTGLNEATTDQTKILEWWLAEPYANIGLRTGVAFDVLDVDGPDGVESLLKLAPGYRHAGPMASTGKGYHQLFVVTGARNAAKKLPGLDFRGQSGYIVSPPSQHPNGHLYLWKRDEPLPEPPNWLFDLVTKPRSGNPTKGVPPEEQANIVYVFLDLFHGIRPLEQIGGRFRTNCIFPDHDDSTPSFWLFPENNSFYCFGCAAWGDTLDLQRSYNEGLARPETWQTPGQGRPPAE